MENILKLLLGFGFIILVSYLVYQIFVQMSSDTYLRLTSEISEVSAGNEKLKEANDLLRVRIDALRSEPRAIERKVRDELGMARPDEVIILLRNFEDPETEDAASLENSEFAE
ncbi:MAG: septum formation initiator family protein [Proteobacteria bacterium]|nr:septum formation initiator family protein [Pseudomonadota bacterium]